MAENKSLNSLLKWGIENSATSTAPPTSNAARSVGSSSLNPEILNAILGGPSDADLMMQSMATIKSKVDLQRKLVAFDSLETLIENLDNANNMDALGLWRPLLEELGSDEGEIRAFAAWCVGTAVQNNAKTQQSLLDHGGIRTLVKLAMDDESQAVRKKAIFALSSAVRNCQPALDETVKTLPEEFKSGELSAGDMEAIDALIQKLRNASAKRGE